MLKFIPKIRIDTGGVQGYSGPGYSWIRVTHDNLLLEEARVGSERDLGRKEVEFSARWQRLWDETDFAVAIAGKPQATPHCDHCSGDTLDGQISCLNKTFCKTCDKAGIIETYKVMHEEEARRRNEEFYRKMATDAEQRQAAHRARLADIQNGFHWRDGWFFGRMPDGAVRLNRVNGEEITEIVIPAPEWASVVCSVSADREIGERWNQAQDFHGRISPLPSPELKP